MSPRHLLRFALSTCLLGTGLIGMPGKSQADEWPLADGVTIRTATREQGKKFLTENDDFVKRMSPFDRAARLRSKTPVTEAQYLRHVSEQVLEFTPEENKRIGELVEKLAEKFAPFHLPWPKTIWLVKTTGEEESGAAYCRGPAVVLPGAQTEENLWLHELFHVLSNQNPDWRKEMYRVVGFQPCPEVAYPESLQDLRITNPDAPRTDSYAELSDGRYIVPVLYSNAPEYDPQKQASFFGYLTFRLMVVEKEGETWKPAQDAGGKPVLLDAGSTPDYFERIGRNTGYIIHPEEVLADNFVLLVQGKKEVATPRILEELGRKLRKEPEAKIEQAAEAAR